MSGIGLPRKASSNAPLNSVPTTRTLTCTTLGSWRRWGEPMRPCGGQTGSAGRSGLFLADFFVGSVLVFARQWDPAIEQLDQRSSSLTRIFGLIIVSWAGLMKQRENCRKRLPSFSARSQWKRTTPRSGQAWATPTRCREQRAEAQKVLDHLKELSAHSCVSPYSVAIIYAGLGEKDQVFAWLERAYKERSYFLAVYLTHGLSSG